MKGVKRPNIGGSERDLLQNGVCLTVEQYTRGRGKQKFLPSLVKTSRPNGRKLEGTERIKVTVSEIQRDDR